MKQFLNNIVTALPVCCFASEKGGEQDCDSDNSDDYLDDTGVNLSNPQVLKNLSSLVTIPAESEYMQELEKTDF